MNDAGEGDPLPPSLPQRVSFWRMAAIPPHGLAHASRSPGNSFDRFDKKAADRNFPVRRFCVLLCRTVRLRAAC